MAGAAAQPKTFTDRLNFLFATVRPPGEDREYTNGEVAAATGVSATYIGYLRRGVRSNPSVEAVQAFARFFGVRPSLLVDDDQDEEAVARAEAQIELMRALRHPAIKRLAMRAADADLSAAGLEAVIAMIDEVGKLERATERRRRGGGRST